MLSLSFLQRAVQWHMSVICSVSHALLAKIVIEKGHFFLATVEQTFKQQQCFILLASY